MEQLNYKPIDVRVFSLAGDFFVCSGRTIFPRLFDNKEEAMKVAEAISKTHNGQWKRRMG